MNPPLESLTYIEVHPSPFNKQLAVPTSKSYANRLLILAAISLEPVTIHQLPQSTDVLNMIACLKKIGLNCLEKGDTITIVNSFPLCESETKEEMITLDSGDGGTTNRFLVALLAKGKKKYRINSLGHMKKRPMDELTTVLEKDGVKIKWGDEKDPFWLEMQGPLQLHGQELIVDCKRSTQFATGLALALADNPQNKIKLLNLESSEQYLLMTFDLIKKFQQGQREFIVPVDFSSLAYPLALGVTIGEVLIQNFIGVDSFQADSVFVDILKQMGADLQIDGAGLHAHSKKQLHGIHIDCSTCPDLTPTLAYVCSYAEGESHLKNIDVLRHKESDRVEEILKLLEAFKIPYLLKKEEKETLVIKGRPEQKVEFLELHPAEDHRMVMVSYLYCRKNNGGKVTNFTHVKKSFPNFFEILGK